MKCGRTGMTVPAARKKNWPANITAKNDAVTSVGRRALVLTP
jgi:hypothetical protein